MDIYHLVGAKFLSFCIIILTKGRIQASAPPFLLSLFMLSSASAFIYLLLAVWMSMHASISAHSFGVKLLTRFVRLPVPGNRDLQALTYKLKAFEHSGIGSLLRVPFQDRLKAEAQPAAERAEDFLKPRTQEQGSLLDDTPVAAQTEQASSSSLDPGGQQPSSSPAAGADGDAFAYAGVDMSGGDSLLAGGEGADPERHIRLFRELQAKWQCYDAYCRVCMGLGVNQVLQVLSYYAVCHTLVENSSPSAGIALVIMFQCTTIALAVLDLAGLKSREILAIQTLGSGPCILTTYMIFSSKRNMKGFLDAEDAFPYAPWAFLCTVVWLEAWVRVAAPSQTAAGLPRRFRQMLFLDVFHKEEEGDGSDGTTPSKIEGALFQEMIENVDDEQRDQLLEVLLDAAKQAASTMTLAQCAVRRWSAVAPWCPSGAQQRKLSGFREQMGKWMPTASAELERCAKLFPELEKQSLSDERSWRELTEEDRLMDPFVRCIMGPFAHDGVDESYYYDIEGEQPVFETNINERCPGALVLSLDATSSILHDLDHDLRCLLEARIVYDLESETSRRRAEFAKRQSERPKPLKPLKPLARKLTPAKAFPALVDLTKEKRLSRRKFKKLSQNEDDESAGKRDLTLAAMAGPDGRYFAPDGLPWQTLSRLTLVLQLCWAWAFAMSLLKEVNVYQHDFGIGKINPKVREKGGRRLISTDESSSLEEVNVTWPHGAFFKPRGIFSYSDEEFVISTPFAWYAMSSIRGTDAGSAYPVELGRSRALSSAALICGEWPASIAALLKTPRCMLGAPVVGGVAMRTLGDWSTDGTDSAEGLFVALEPSLTALSQLPRRPRSSGGAFSRTPRASSAAERQLKRSRRSGATPPAMAGTSSSSASWRLLTGSALRCGGIARSLLPGGERNVATFCLLLASFDGSSISLSVAPLPADAGDVDEDVASSQEQSEVSSSPPSLHASLSLLGTAVQAPAADAGSSLEALYRRRNRREAEVLGLHLSPGGRRLWVLLADGTVEAYDLRRAEALGRWRLRWPALSLQSQRLRATRPGALDASSESMGEVSPAMAAAWAGDFVPVGLCEHGSRHLLVLGRVAIGDPNRRFTDDLGGDDARREEPLLLRVSLPEDLIRADDDVATDSATRR
eukprot:TRINITY_DN2413_c0_g7_i1.p1 TRINITY_DN2413_c0_g7~~TRINITY_DN2413_c0_g7_i1.p1  ORF type:complete len:1177 (-),score=221.48 TRINITY_DN2413_c0_g7_i1:6-3413(-)